MGRRKVGTAIEHSMLVNRWATRVPHCSSPPRTVDLYEILQVSPRAEAAVIEAVYRRLVRVYDPASVVADDTDPFLIGLRLAYETLRDPARRAAYDRRRHE
jgi:curved DNA-binding protein CbpA